MKGDDCMFTNRKINGYVYETRYIASWLRGGGQLCTGDDIDIFRDWLISMNLTDDEVSHITYLATNGKLELEYNARKFLSNLQ
jgi:hypothetical protein